MAGLRCAEVASRPTEFLDVTGFGARILLLVLTPTGPIGMLSEVPTRQPTVIVMPEAHKRVYRHPKYKTAYRVKNWAEYDKALRERGDGSVSKVDMATPIPLIYETLFFSLSTFETPPNAGRPHMALGPGIPQPPVSLPAPLQVYRHQMPAPRRVVARPILGGLHHEYELAAAA